MNKRLFLARMPLSKDDVKRLAELSRIELEPEEAARMEQTLDPILEYVSRLSAIETAGVPEVELEDEGLGFRQDVERGDNQAERSIILRNFPDREGDALKVPAVFENPKQ